MSTDAATTERTPVSIPYLVGILVMLITIGLLLRTYGSEDMGSGFLVSGGLGVAVAAVVRWRVSRHPERSSTPDRAVAFAVISRRS
jgi:uncharacterized membrane protein